MLGLFVWTVDGVIKVVLLGLAVTIFGGLFLYGVLPDIIREWWRRKKRK